MREHSKGSAYNMRKAIALIPGGLALAAWLDAYLGFKWHRENVAEPHLIDDWDGWSIGQRAAKTSMRKVWFVVAILSTILALGILVLAPA